VYDYGQNTYPDYDGHPNISFFSPDKKFGKTLEYEILRINPTADFLINDLMKNKKQIKVLMTAYAEKKSIEQMLSILSKSDENERIANGIRSNTSWEDDDKKKALIASRYLNSVGKGENALELARILEENLEKKDTEGFKDFVVPTYIKEAIELLCQ
jgi:hypothetical protein